MVSYGTFHVVSCIIQDGHLQKISKLEREFLLQSLPKSSAAKSVEFISNKSQSSRTIVSLIGSSWFTINLPMGPNQFVLSSPGRCFSASFSAMMFLLRFPGVNSTLQVGQQETSGLSLQGPQMMCPLQHWYIFFGRAIISRHTGHSSSSSISDDSMKDNNGFVSDFSNNLQNCSELFSPELPWFDTDTCHRLIIPSTCTLSTNFFQQLQQTALLCW